jgi:hypothetical protein
MSEAHAEALKARYAIWKHQDGNLKAPIRKIVDAMLEEKIGRGSQGGLIVHNGSRKRQRQRSCERLIRGDGINSRRGENRSPPRLTTK